MKCKALYLVLLLILSTFFIISCGKEKDNGKIKLTYGYFVGVIDKPYMQECMDTFQKENPDIELEPQPTPWEQYFQKLNVRFAAENPPDVIMMSTEYVDACVDGENLLNLNQFIDKDTTFSLKDYYPGNLERLSRDGKLYVLPRDTDVMACIYYNKNMFKRFHLKEPTDDWTWQEFFTDCTTFAQDTNHDGKQDLWGISIYGFFHAFVYSNGGKLVDDWRHPTRMTLDDPNTVEGFKLWQDLTLKYKAMPSGVALRSLGVSEPDMFTQSRMAMFLAGIWMTPQFDKITTFDWDIAAIPKGPHGPRKFMVESSGYAITKFCKHPEAAWKLVKFLGGEPGQKIMSKPGLTLPALMTLANSTIFLNGQKPGNRKLMTWSALDGMYNPMFTDYREIETSYINPAVEQMMNPDPKKYLPAEKMLKDLNKKLNKEFFEIKE